MGNNKSKNLICLPELLCVSFFLLSGTTSRRDGYSSASYTGYLIEKANSLHFSPVAPRRTTIAAVGVTIFRFLHFSSVH